MECVYGRSSQCSDMASEDYLHVNNFGYYREPDIPIRVHRTGGRKDWQLIYIERGSGSFLHHGKIETAKDGYAAIYRPGEEQLYTFDAVRDSEYYWIHFSGSETEKILDRLMLRDSVFFVGEIPGIGEKIKKMTDACRIEGSSTDDFLTGCLITMLAEIAGKLYAADCTMVKVIETMQKETADMGCNAEYAKICGLSEYHFIRRFKECTGMSPHRYKVKLLMEKAAELLSKTDMNVSEVAELLGYGDSLYFSRVFKKQHGVSPRRYRRG